MEEGEDRLEKERNSGRELMRLVRVEGGGGRVEESREERETVEDEAG